MSVSQKFCKVSPSSTLAIDAAYKAMKAKGQDVVGFGAGEPDFDTPPHIKEAAINAINTGFTKYTPASGTVQLKEAVCRKFKRDNNLDYQPNQIVVSNGAKHSLMNAFGAILNPLDEVIVPSPFWVSYPELIALNDGVSVFLNTFEQDNFKFSKEQLKAAITPKTKAILINSPSNPTGMVYSKEQLFEVAEIALEHNLYVISDEVYEYLIYDGDQHTSIASHSPEMKERTILVNGVSKTYSMTGWRIGYTASSEEIAKLMANVQSHATSNPNSIAQMAAIAALDGSMAYTLTMKNEFMLRRDFMVEAINNLPLVSCLKPDGAFYVMMNIKELLDKTGIKNSDEFCKILLEQAKVALVPGSGFGADNYVRWSYATSMETIKIGIKRLEEYINAL